MKTKDQSHWWLCGTLLLVAVIFSNCSSTKSPHGLDGVAVGKMIGNHSFIFVADRANPLRGRTRVLTSSYDVRVSNDSLISFLPYFGRAHSAPMNPTEVSTQFTSTNFSYESRQVKDNQWRITIKPKDQPAIQELNFDIFENGTASLSLISTSKDPITYTGYIKKTDSQ